MHNLQIEIKVGLKKETKKEVMTEVEINPKQLRQKHPKSRLKNRLNLRVLRLLDHQQLEDLGLEVLLSPFSDRDQLQLQEVVLKAQDHSLSRPSDRDLRHYSIQRH